MHSVVQKWYVGLLLVGVFLTFASHIFAEATQSPPLDQKRLWEAEKLVVQVPNDSYGALHGLPPEEIKKTQEQLLAREQERLHRIRNEKDLGRYVVALADRYLSIPGADGIPSIFHAMSMRADIPPSDIERFTQLAGEVLRDPQYLPHPTGEDLVVGIAPVLAAHPSVQNMDMLVKMLHSGNDYTAIRFKMAAGKAIAEAGLTSALEDMRTAAQWLRDLGIKAKSNDTQKYGQMFDGYIRQLESSKASLQSPDTKVSHSSATDHPNEPVKEEEPSPETTSWLAWLILSGAGAALLFLLLQKRR